MRIYSKHAFFTYNQNYNSMLVVYLNGREERLSLAKFEKLNNCNIMLEGVTYNIKDNSVRRIA